MSNHPNRGRKPRPRLHLEAAGKLYPGAWKEFDRFREMRGEGLPDWPDWCYCPLAAAYAIVSGGGDNRVPLHQVGDVARLGALAAWRVTQGIYRFDPALRGELWDTPVTGDLPADTLYRLPEWCVYVETDADFHGDPLYGYWAHLEWDANHGRTELRLLLDTDSALIPVPLHIGHWSLDEALQRMTDTARTWAATEGAQIPDLDRADLRATIEPLVWLLLYLCQEEPDVTDWPPARPRPKRTKKGWRLFPADKPRQWEVGERIGAALRRARQAEETDQREPDAETGRNRPRPHIRRAHWHTYRIGEGKQYRTIRWMPPIPINVDDPEGLPATVRPVKK